MPRIMVERWECSKGHLHTTRELEQRCEESVSIGSKLRMARLGHVVEMREGGSKAFREIGELLGVSGQRAQQLYVKACRMRKHPGFAGWGGN